MRRRRSKQSSGGFTVMAATFTRSDLISWTEPDRASEHLADERERLVHTPRNGEAGQQPACPDHAPLAGRHLRRGGARTRGPRNRGEREQAALDGLYGQVTDQADSKKCHQ